MNDRIYDASMAAGLCIATVGAGVQWGWPVAMVFGGVGVMAATWLASSR
jgi:hypothetical protein